LPRHAAAAVIKDAPRASRCAQARDFARVRKDFFVYAESRRLRRALRHDAGAGSVMPIFHAALRRALPRLLMTLLITRLRHCFAAQLSPRFDMPPHC